MIHSYFPHRYVRRQQYNHLLRCIMDEFGLDVPPTTKSCSRVQAYITARRLLIALMDLYGWNEKEIGILTGLSRNAIAWHKARNAELYGEDKEYTIKYDSVDKNYHEALIKFGETGKFS